MHLVEVLMAGSVFTLATGSSMQIWSNTALQAQQWSTQQQLEQRMEQDRLQLMGQWRQAAAPISAVPTSPGAGCALGAADLMALAKPLPVPPALERQLQLSADGQGLEVVWRTAAAPHLQRQRLVTAAGLGLCVPAPLPVSPVQEVLP